MTDAATPAVGNELFLHNMRALWRTDPELAMRVDAVDDEERFELERTRSGAWTARVQAPDGKAVYLHSRHDPIEEARRFVASTPTQDKYCYVISGLGLGYHVHALNELLRGDAFMICSEPTIPLIATALTCVDLAEPIASRRLVILADDDKRRLHDRIGERSTLMMLGAHFIRHPPSIRLATDAHAAATKAIAEFVTFTRMSLVTLIANSRITCRNIAMNLGRYMSTPPIDILRDRFAGDPAIIVSAGPSLSKNIEQLAAFKGRAVICAVQTTVKPLMGRGVVPDFITTLDFHEMSRKFFEDVGDLSETHLIAEPKATWHVLDHYPGPLSVLDNHWARMVIGDELAARDGLQAGATVAHLALYLAIYMGCDPIIFVGQDLAFTGHVFYVPGVEIHRAWRQELNRFNSIEHKEWDRIVRNRPILRRVAGVDGDKLYTDELLLTYLEQFEKDIAAVRCRMIDATEGGARIRGTDVMSLGDVSRLIGERRIDPQRFAYKKSVNWNDPSRLGATREQLALRIEEVQQAMTVCDELLTLLDELEGMTEDPTKFNRRLVRVDELRSKVHQESLAYRIVNSFTQLAELRRFSADRKIMTLDASDSERALSQIKRDKEFMTGVRDGARDLGPILTEALARIEAGEDNR
ncbi:MAG: motility associated factor glycosyltransferase family protein [Planctomycetes bacterium]|nr:motility associated factor glycosyltransferase family protein [Planctomycetota bacterium]